MFIPLFWARLLLVLYPERQTGSRFSETQLRLVDIEQWWHSSVMGSSVDSTSILNFFPFIYPESLSHRSVKKSMFPQFLPGSRTENHSRDRSTTIKSQIDIRCSICHPQTHVPLSIIVLSRFTVSITPHHSLLLQLLLTLPPINSSPLAVVCEWERRGSVATTHTCDHHPPISYRFVKVTCPSSSPAIQDSHDVLCFLYCANYSKYRSHMWSSPCPFYTVW